MCTQRTNYRNCETVYSFEVVIIVTALEITTGQQPMTAWNTLWLATLTDDFQFPCSV